MIYNAQRQRVRATNDPMSTCPDCGEDLFARRGDERFRIWHWAHYGRPTTMSTQSCVGVGETTWHLEWKLAYDGFDNWSIEQPFNNLRIDAMNIQTGSVREFVHSLSPHYVEKHRALQTYGCDVRWIIDGNKFVSKRLKYTNDGDGIRQPLMPHVYALFADLDRRCWLHFDNRLWREWKNDVWYPRSDQRMMDHFLRVRDELETEAFNRAREAAVDPRRLESMAPRVCDPPANSFTEWLDERRPRPHEGAPPAPGVHDAVK